MGKYLFAQFWINRQGGSSEEPSESRIGGNGITDTTENVECKGSGKGENNGAVLRIQRESCLVHPPTPCDMAALVDRANRDQSKRVTKRARAVRF